MGYFASKHSTAQQPVQETSAPATGGYFARKFASQTQQPPSLPPQQTNVPVSSRRQVQPQKPKGWASFILPSLRETLTTRRGLTKVAKAVPEATTEALPLIKNFVEFIRIAADSKKEQETIARSLANETKFTTIIQQKLKNATPEKRDRLRALLAGNVSLSPRDTTPESLRSTGQTLTTALGRTVQTGAALAYPHLRGVPALQVVAARGAAGLGFGTGKIIEERQSLQQAIPTLATSGGAGLLAGGLEVGTRAISSALRPAPKQTTRHIPITENNVPQPVTTRVVRPQAPIAPPPAPQVSRTVPRASQVVYGPRGPVQAPSQASVQGNIDILDDVVRLRGFGLATKQELAKNPVIREGAWRQLFEKLNGRPPSHTDQIKWMAKSPVDQLGTIEVMVGDWKASALAPGAAKAVDRIPQVRTQQTPPVSRPAATVNPTTPTASSKVADLKSILQQEVRSVADQKRYAAAERELQQLLRTQAPAQPNVTVPVSARTNPISTATSAQRQRGFAETVIGTKGTNPKVAAGIDSTYTPITNRDTVAAARGALQSTSLDDALRQVRTPGPVDAKRTVQAMILIKKLQSAGRIDDAIDLTERVAKELTAQGQSIQAASLYGRLTSSGALRFAQRTVDQINRDTARRLGVDVTSLSGKNLLKLSPKLANQISNRAGVIQSMPEGMPKTVEIGKLMRDVASVIPSSASRKASTLQIIAQLGNPKTLLRNVVGNTGFAGLETANRPTRVTIDKLVSLITKQRTASFAGGKQEISGAIEGAKIGVLEAKHGIRIGELATQLDLPKQRVFRKGVLGFFEKALDWGLRLPDRIGYQSAARGKMAELNALVRSGKLKLTPEQIAQIADNYGRYRTFQDLSPAATGFSKIKTGLNFGREFGMGDLVLKYPKTPGNLLARAVDYSPLGFIRALTKFGSMVSGRITNKTWSPIIQGEFVDAFSRAITGTAGLVGTGYALKNVGLLTRTTKESDKDLSALERELGTGPYRINLDGLWRYLTSGFEKSAAQLRPGDRLMSYDWFQPNAVMIAMGARLADKETGAPSVASTIINSLAEGINTIAEQPLVTGIKRLFGAGDVTKGLVNALLSAPASFIPTVFNQIGQALDNKQRETYSNLWWQEMYYEVARKIPYLKNTVPERINIFGNEAQQYQEGSNSIFNVFFNPAFLSTYQPTEMAHEIVRLYDQTGEKSHIPSLVAQTQTINGEKRTLSPQEYEEMQRYVGAWNTKLFLEAMAQPYWTRLPDIEKQKELESIVSDTRLAARIKLFGHKPDSVPKNVQRILDQKTPDPLKN